MSWQTFWLFVTVTFFVSATPGPNMLLVMSSSARFGFRSSVATMAGCLAALLAMLSISAAGLGALLQAFPAVFDAL
ncbi:MAG TPA: LysE family transporter, partial [Steroidobacteraceae bacterium]